MSEAGDPSNPTPDDQPSYSDEAKFFIEQPDGPPLTIEEVIMKERGTAQAEFDLSLLKPGDLLAMQYTNEDGSPGGEFFEVEQADLAHLDAGADCPGTILRGKLHGASVDPDIQDKTILLKGSGWGGPSVSEGIMVTGRQPHYIMAGKNGRPEEIHRPVINNFEIFRKNADGALVEKTPNELAQELIVTNETHRQRLASVEELVKVVGIKGFDITKAFPEPGQQSDWRYETQRFQLVAGMKQAMGSSLSIYDKQSRTWLCVDYHSAHNEDYLQISFADLKDADPAKFDEEMELAHLHRIPDSGFVSRSGASITTFTSSEQRHITATYFQIGEHFGRESGFPTRSNRYTGKDDYVHTAVVKIEGKPPRLLKHFYMHLLEEEDPQKVANLESSIETKTDSDGNHYLAVNGHLFRADNPLKTLHAFIENLKSEQIRAGKASK